MAGRKRPAESDSVPSAKKQIVEKESEGTAEEVSLTLTPTPCPSKAATIIDFCGLSPHFLRSVAAALPLL